MFLEQNGLAILAKLLSLLPLEISFEGSSKAIAINLQNSSGGTHAIELSEQQLPPRLPKREMREPTK